MSLFGALCLSMLGLAFPAILDICVKYPNYGYKNYIVYKNLFLIFIAICGLIIGTFINLKIFILLEGI